MTPHNFSSSIPDHDMRHTDACIAHLEAQLRRKGRLTAAETATAVGLYQDVVAARKAIEAQLRPFAESCA